MSMNTLLFVGLIVAAVILFSVFGDSDEIEDEIEDEFEDTIEDGLEGGLGMDEVEFEDEGFEEGGFEEEE